MADNLGISRGIFFSGDNVLAGSHEISLIKKAIKLAILQVRFVSVYSKLLLGGKMFSLDPVLEADTALIGQFDLSLVLLNRDANYPWAVLVPKRQSISEIFQLSSDDQHSLMAESSCLAEALTEIFSPDKLNIAAIGNVVEQLHVHHV